MLYQLSYTLFTRIHAAGLEPATTALQELEVALQIANLDNNLIQRTFSFFAEMEGLEPTLLGLTGRSYIPLKLHLNFCSPGEF